RIGHGVRLLPFPYNHPIRAAEMAALLDCVCDGRLEFGTGRSATRDELEGFGIDPQETRGMWEEALEVIVGAWTTDVFSWEGTHFRVPPRRRRRWSTRRRSPRDRKSTRLNSSHLGISYAVFCLK